MKRINQAFPILIMTLAAVLTGCKSKDDSKTTPITTTTPTTTFFAKGADVGWITEMESQGINFYDSVGTQTEVLSLLKSKGINAVRLRAWVNPADGWCNTKDVVVKAKRAAALGMKIMIDFHYSDSWADPSKQPTPKAWSAFTIVSDMQTALYNYTVGVMDTLVNVNGITPDWVQIGNETDDGMDWELGRASTDMYNFAKLVYSGYTAVKSVSKTTQVIVHLSNGWNNATYEWMFDGLKANGAMWDIIGMSLYPSYASGGASAWSTVNTQCLANMTDMISRYNTQVMIVEVGMPWDDAATCKAFLSDIIAKTKAIPNNKGLGVFYWEPECYNNWGGYSLGAFDNSGKPTVAMDAFLE